MYQVAVVVPVYNTEKYLHRCIKSLLSQKEVQAQFIFVDDGSSDNSHKILRHYQKIDDRVVLISKKNAGQGIARNLAISVADAEYLYFVDSDDYLGDGTLAKLYNASKKHNLDICSPGVPSHYFDYDVDYIPCLPCKSQFVRSKIVKEYSISQPDVRSGQDGVFSHLVLTQCERVGMVRDAKFHYTHSREGSTFATYLKKPEMVPQFLREHYQAINEFYDRHQLWERNAVRILLFVKNESLRNRFYPHYEALSESRRQDCLDILSKVVKKAYQYIGKEIMGCLTEDIIALANRDFSYFSSQKSVSTAANSEVRIQAKHSFTNKAGIKICKLGAQLPSEVNKKRLPSEAAPDDRAIIAELRGLSKKLDFAINAGNNNAIASLSSTRSVSDSLSSGDQNIVVSLTTLKSRLPSVHFALESIFSQTVLPGKVVLWVSDNFLLKDHLTPDLRKLIGRGVEIRQVKDVGPHTKLIYALKEFQDKNIVTVDDDIIYPNNTIHLLKETARKHPNCIVANWARELAFDNSGKVLGVRDGRLLTPPMLESKIEQDANTNRPTLLAFPYGTSGVFYPPGCLDDRVFDVDLFQKLCPKEDDIWFKAMSMLKRTPVVATNMGINPNHHCITGSQIEALRHYNHGETNNRKQMSAVFDMYDLYSLLD